MSSSKCELKHKIEVKSYHFETEFTEKDFGPLNVAFMLTTNYRRECPCVGAIAKVV